MDGPGQSFDLRGALFGVDQRTTGVGSAAEDLDPRIQKDGRFGGAVGLAAYSYTRPTKRGGWVVDGTGSVADYSIGSERLTTSASVDAGVTTTLRRKIVFGSAVSASYSPYYNLGVLSNGAGIGSVSSIGIVDQALPTSEFGLAAIASPNINASGSMNITDHVTRRSSFSIGGDWRAVYLLDSSTGNAQTFNGHATFTHKVARRLSFHLGYGQSVITFNNDSAAGPLRSNNIDGGLDFADTLQIARRTTLSFGSSTALLHWNGRTDFRVNGNALIGTTFNRTWSASAGYGRDSSFVAGFVDPILSDSANASFGGLIASRVRWTSGAGWSRGQIGLGTSDHFISYVGTSELSVAIVRSAGVYAQYGYSRYQVPPGATTLPILSRFSRQTLIAGLTVWVPLINARRAS